MTSSIILWWNFGIPMNAHAVKQQRDLVIAQIKVHVPIMEHFFGLKDTLRQYSAKLNQFTVSPLHFERQNLIRTKLRAKILQLFGEQVEKKLKVNLEGALAFNIADHHQVLNHPFIISSNIVSSAGKLIQADKQDAIIVVSSGDVPPNNYFSLNGFQFHGKRIPLFSTSEREWSSYYIPKRNFDFIARLRDIGRWGEFTQEEQEFLEKEQAKILSWDYTRCTNYLDQISVIVRESWPFLFSAGLRPALPELIYVTQEELVTECLINLLQQDNFLSASLFDQWFRQRVLDNFRGIVVTWREQEAKGTHFFWRKYPGEPRSLRLYVEGNNLVPQDARFKDYAVPLERDAIIELLKRREIYPSLFTIFSTLNFYAGVKPLVGYGSVVYLTLMKEVWEKTLAQSPFANEVALVKEVDTTGFVAGLALFFKRLEGRVRTLYAHDIFYDGGVNKDYLHVILDMKFSDLASVGAADMYDYYASKYIPQEQHIKPDVNFDDLAELTFNWL